MAVPNLTEFAGIPIYFPTDAPPPTSSSSPVETASLAGRAVTPPVTDKSVEGALRGFQAVVLCWAEDVASVMPRDDFISFSCGDGDDFGEDEGPELSQEELDKLDKRYAEDDETRRREAVYRIVADKAFSDRRHTLCLSDDRVRFPPPGLNWLHWVTELSICHTNLTQLPQDWPPNLDTLQLCGNQLTGPVLGLPQNLKRLGLSWNELTCFPKDLPKGLTHLDLAHNKDLAIIPSELPQQLVVLDLSSCRIEKVPPGLPSTLRELDLSYNGVKKVTSELPDGLTHLLLRGHQLGNLPSWPTELEDLDLSRDLDHLPCCLDFFNHLPPRLMRLDVSGHRLEQSLFFNLSQNIQTLCLRFASLTHFPESLLLLPNLQTLILSDNYIQTLPLGLQYLPQTHLQRLSLENNRIASLPSDWLLNLDELGEGIDLDLAHNRLMSLPASLTGLPSRCQLRLHGNRIVLSDIYAFSDASDAQRAINPRRGPRICAYSNYVAPPPWMGRTHRPACSL